MNLGWSPEQWRRQGLRTITLALQLSGLFVITHFATAFEHGGGVRNVWLVVIGVALYIVPTLRAAVVERDRERLQLVFAAVLSVDVAWELAKSVAKRGHSPDARLLVAVLILVCFVSPIFAISIYWRRFQDEFQRSLASGAATVTLVVLIIAAFGYWVLDKTVGVPALSPLWVCIGGASVWLVTWFVLRQRSA